jgi:ADP-ribose pyrophosphatase
MVGVDMSNHSSVGGHIPRVVRRVETRLSPWVTLVEKDLELAAGAPAQTYHAFKQSDYVAILAVTASGLTPIIRQYRPAIERFTWELPAGLLESGESAVECCRRELREEAGLEALQIHHLGTGPAEVGRLENDHHMFWVEADEPRPGFIPEPGTTIELITRAELDARIVAGEVAHPLHLAVLLLYDLRMRTSSRRSLGRG